MGSWPMRWGRTCPACSKPMSPHCPKPNACGWLACVPCEIALRTRDGKVIMLHLPKRRMQLREPRPLEDEGDDG